MPPEVEEEEEDDGGWGGGGAQFLGIFNIQCMKGENGEWSTSVHEL